MLFSVNIFKSNFFLVKTNKMVSVIQKKPEKEPESVETKSKSSSFMDPVLRDVLVDSVLYATMFYVLANKQMYSMTSKILPKMISDRVLLHAVVFMMLYLIIQKLTSRV